MSLVTRLLGFGSCLVGAFAIGYVQGVQSISGTINNLVVKFGGSIPSLASTVAAMVTSHVQQDVDPNLNLYLVVGLVLAVGGFVLVARGDRKPKSGEEQAPPDHSPSK